MTEVSLYEGYRHLYGLSRLLMNHAALTLSWFGLSLYITPETCLRWKCHIDTIHRIPRLALL